MQASTIGVWWSMGRREFALHVPDCMLHRANSLVMPCGRMMTPLCPKTETRIVSGPAKLFSPLCRLYWRWNTRKQQTSTGHASTLGAVALP